MARRRRACATTLVPRSTRPCRAPRLAVASRACARISAGSSFQATPSSARVQRPADGIVARSRVDAPPREQPLVVRELELAVAGRASCVRHIAVEQLANDGFDGHRRNQRPVVAFRKEMPRALDRVARGVPPATATNMPPRCSPQRARFVTKCIERRERRQRPNPAPANEPSARDQRAVQNLGHGARSHPNAIDLGPELREHAQVRHVDEREQPCYAAARGRAARS